MAEERKDLPPPSGGNPPKPQPMPPTDAPPTDPATTPKPPGESPAAGPPGPPPEESGSSAAPVSGKPVLAGAVPEGAGRTSGSTPSGAPLGSRIGAAVIDALVALAIGWLVTTIMPDAIAGVLSWLAASAYWLFRDSLAPLKGQSLGKMALRLKAVDKSGRGLVNQWQTGLLRNLLLIVPFGGLIELIVLLVRQGKPEAGRRLGDDWARTRVIELPAPTTE